MLFVAVCIILAFFRMYYFELRDYVKFSVNSHETMIVRNAGMLGSEAQKDTNPPVCRQCINPSEGLKE